MRAVHFCDVCDFRLPYCVRTDRRFCSSRCRVWSQRHPGIKRLYVWRGGVRLPKPPGKGQPKTFAAALLALAESRKYAAQLEAIAKAQKSAEQKLIAEVAALRDELAQAKNHLATVRGELANTEQRMAQAERSAADEIKDLREQVAERAVRLKDAQDAAAAQLKLSEELTRDRDALRSRAEDAERGLAQRDEDLRQQGRSVAAAERANQEVQVVAELESRRLRAEKELRIAAEKQVQQLLIDLEALASEKRLEMTDDGMAVLFGKRADILAAELAAVRTHRDEIDAERELLAARILRLMAPGQYLAHATAAGYDVTKDPLIRLKREEIRVENRYRGWQEAHKKPRRARRYDPEQTLDEQAYAGALAARWRLIDRPHLRQKQQPKWVAIGILLDSENEQYVLARTQDRIDSMQRKMGAAC